MFHDATVSRFVLFDDQLRLDTEELSVGANEKMLPSRILIRAIGDIYRNGKMIDAFRVESDDDEVVELKNSTEEVELTLIWHFWNPSTPDVFGIYLFPMADLHTESISGGPLMLVRPGKIRLKQRHKSNRVSCFEGNRQRPAIARKLGSGLIADNQKITVAARAMAER